MIGVGSPSEIFGGDPLMVVSGIADEDLVSIGVLSPVEIDVISPSVDVFESDVEDDCVVENSSVVALIDVTSVKMRVLPVNGVEISGYGLICTRNLSVGLFAP